MPLRYGQSMWLKGAARVRRLELLLVSICLVATLILSAGSHRQNEAVANKDFSEITDDSIRALQTRMQGYLQSLHGVAAFIASSENVTSAEFENYVARLDISSFLKGINGIGLIEPVNAGEEEAFLAQKVADGVRLFEIKPDTDSAQRYVITQIAPHDANKEALGLDITFEEGRRLAARRARNTGLAQMTPRILLVQDETKTPGFLLLRPLWTAGTASDSGEVTRRSVFRGWVYAPFIGSNLLKDLTPNQGRNYHFSVYAGETADPDMVIYDPPLGEAGMGKYTRIHQANLYGQKWMLEFHSTRNFDAAVASNEWIIILAVGGLLALLIHLGMRNLRRRGEMLRELAAMRGRKADAQEAETRAAVENAVIPIFVLDGDRRVLFANQAACDCFGHSPAQITSMPFDAMVTDPPRELAEDGYNALGYTRKGEERVLDVQYNDWTSFDGAPRTTAILRDLTAQHNALKEIKHTKTLYDQALAGAQIGVFDVDLVNGTSEVSATWRSIMGLEGDGTPVDTQAHFLSRIHPDDRHILEAADRACIAGYTARSAAEYRVSFGPDTWRWMHSDAVVVERDSEGNARRMIGTQSDVTDLRHARNALEASEQLFRQVQAAAPIGMALMNDKGQFVGVNKAFCAVTGRDEKMLLNDLRLSDLLPYEEMKAVYAGVSDMMENRASEVYEGQHRYYSPTGHERWCQLHITWSFDRNANRHFFIAQVSDITDQRKMDQIKNEFVATVSHELRTPLTSIKGALGLIQGGNPEALPAGTKRLIEIASSNADRLTALVNDILDLQKISSGAVEFDMQTLCLSETIRASLTEMEPFAATHNNTLALDLPEHSLCVEADPGRTRQVLANLISNACKYSDADSEVLVKAEQVDDKILVCVQNIGPGVPESFRAQVFDAFTQADGSDTRAEGGTGLGLNITKQIVARHGGDIGFESTQNGITVFWFTYPVAAADAVPEVEIAPHTHDPSAVKLQVLHLEDDQDFAEVVRSGLQDVAEVRHVSSLAQAREALRQDCAVDVVILDWSLPDGDAGALIDDICDSCPGVRLLALSADSERRRDKRVHANLVKSRTELSTIATYVAGKQALVS